MHAIVIRSLMKGEIVLGTSGVTDRPLGGGRPREYPPPSLYPHVRASNLDQPFLCKQEIATGRCLSLGAPSIYKRISAHIIERSAKGHLTMEKIMTTLFLSTLLSMFLLATADPVLDDQGNNVTTDGSYYIEIDGITNFQKLTLKSINESCPRYVAYDFQQAIPVRFSPFFPGNTIEGGHWYRFRIEFTSAPYCAGNGEWTVDSSYVVAGGNDPTLGRRYFAVLGDEESGKYTLGDCRRCGACKDLCTPIGLDSGGFLKTDVETPLKVLFRKASYGRRSTNHAMGSLLGRSAE